MFGQQAAAARKIVLLIAASVRQLVDVSGTVEVQTGNKSTVAMNGIDYFIASVLKQPRGGSVMYLDDWIRLIQTTKNMKDVAAFVRANFPLYRGWVHEMRNYIAQARKTTPAEIAKVFGDPPGCKGCADVCPTCGDCTECRSANVLNALIGAEIQICTMDNNYEICRMEKFAAPPLVLQPKQHNISLDALWQEKCGVESADPEWLDSLFCALGEGNTLANFVMRMRFRVPENMNRNVLMSLYGLLSGIPKPIDKTMEGVLNAFIGKIKERSLFSWSDLATIIKVINTIKPINDYVDRQLSNYGVTTQPVQPTNVTRSEYARENDKKGQPTVALDKMWQAYCVSGPNEPPAKWAGTLFCELGLDNPAARFVAKMRFVVPPGDANNHAVMIILKIIEDGLKTPDPITREQTWTKWGIEKGLNWAVSGIREKILNGERLSWNDLDAIYNLTTSNFTSIPIIGNKIAQAFGSNTISDRIEMAANEALNPKGIDFASSI